MEQLDNEILQDIQEQMNQCTTLSIRYISILSGNFANIPNAISSSECQQILKKLLTSLIMENNPSKVLSFLSVPICCKKRSRLLQQKRRCCYSSDVAKLMFSS